MTPRRLATTLFAILLGGLFAIGIWQLGEGLWIYAKARLAQQLLQQAWLRTAAGTAQAKPWPWADTWPIARLTVPSLGIDEVVLEGAYGRTLAFGPGHVESGHSLETETTVILTGHRDTHFAFLQRVRMGEKIQLDTAAGTHLRYHVTRIQVVDSGIPGLGVYTDAPTLVLVTCYPFNAIEPGGPLRYVVVAAREAG